MKREKICLSKKEGGLGLRRMKEFNEACLLKLGWAAASVDSMWAVGSMLGILRTPPSGTQAPLRAVLAFGKS